MMDREQQQNHENKLNHENQDAWFGEHDEELNHEHVDHKRQIESTQLLAYLNSLGVREAVACTAAMMETWTVDQGVYTYELGTHAEIYYLDYELSFNGSSWLFDPTVKNRAEFLHFDLRNGLLEAVAMQRDKI